MMELQMILFVSTAWLIFTEAQVLQQARKTNGNLTPLISGFVEEFLSTNSPDSKNYETNNIVDRTEDPLSSKLDQQVASVLMKQLSKKLELGKRRKYKELANSFEAFNSPFQGCSNESYPGSETGKIKTYTINLDSKPEDRWKEVIEQKKDQIRILAKYFEILFGKNFMSAVDKYISWLHQTLPQEYFLELKGIAELTNISIGRITLYNVFYEFFSVCTSIVLEGEDGKMYHGRNLDFGLFMGWDAKKHAWFVTDILRPLIIKLEFHKNGKPLYSAVTYAGFTGILTGVKKNTFSLTINERFVMDGGYVGIAEWIMGRRDTSWIGLLTRKVMESAQSYEEAAMMLTTTSLVAPTYFILAGNSSGKGCIVTRGRRDFDIWQLGSRHENQSGKWFLVETNLDHWRPMPFFDHRRQYAVECMDKLGRHQPLDTLYKALSTKPVLNKLTTFTAMMEVTTGLVQVWQRECEDPCWPI